MAPTRSSTLRRSSPRRKAATAAATAAAAAIVTPQSVGFALFIFSVGYQAGPRFFDVLRTDGLKYFLLALVIAAFEIVGGTVHYEDRTADPPLAITIAIPTAINRRRDGLTCRSATRCPTSSSTRLERR